MRPAITAYILAVTLLLFALPAVRASSGSIPLLTVSDVNESEIGGIAELHLETRQGTGAIFLDSFPLTKIDTQISIRTAKQIACDISGIDCASTDFFYTIHSGSSLVSGPSAGAAATVLTIAVLQDLPIDNSTIITGTINPGGVIGPVAGVPAKVQAAIDSGYRHVLIPRFDIDDGQNASDNAGQNALAETITDPLARIVRVSTIYDALPLFTGKSIPFLPGNISLPDAYTERMRSIASQLCSAITPSALRENLTGDASTASDNPSPDQPPLTTNTRSGTNSSNLSAGSPRESVSPTEQYRRAEQALADHHYYSAASYCFTAGVYAKQVSYQNMTKEQRNDRALQLRALLKSKDLEYSSKKLTSMGDLETFMIVKERLVEAETLLSGTDGISVRDLAYADERIESAVSWSVFFGAFPSPALPAPSGLEQTCIAKVNEAEERTNYIAIYFPSLMDRTDLDKARAYYQDKEYPLCIFSATKAKSGADAVLTALYLEQSQVKDLVDEKLRLAKQVLLREEQKGAFPILGYSYYEYAASLAQHNPSSAIIYAEYSLDLSNLDLYIPPKGNAFVLDVKDQAIPRTTYVLLLFVLMLGISIGVILGVIVAKRIREDTTKATRRRSRPLRKR